MSVNIGEFSGGTYFVKVSTEKCIVQKVLLFLEEERQIGNTRFINCQIDFEIPNVLG